MMESLPRNLDSRNLTLASVSRGCASRTAPRDRGPRRASRTRRYVGSRRPPVGADRARTPSRSASNEATPPAGSRSGPGPAAVGRSADPLRLLARYSGGPKQCHTRRRSACDRHHPLLARRADPDRRVRPLHRAREQAWRRAAGKLPALEREPVGREAARARSARPPRAHVDALLERRERDAELGVLLVVTRRRRTRPRAVRSTRGRS